MVSNDPLPPVPDEVHQALAYLHAFSQDDAFAEARDLAETLFWGDWESVLSSDEVEDLRADPSVELSFTLGLMVDLEGVGGESIAHGITERLRGDASPAVIEAIRAIADTHIDVFRVETVRGTTVTLAGLFDPSIRRTTQLEPPPEHDDLVAARLFPVGAETAHSLDSCFFPADYEPRLREALEEERAALESVAGPTDMATYLKQAGLRFHSLWLEAITGVDEGSVPEEPPEMFLVDAVAPLVRALDACDRLEIADDDRWLLGGADDGVTLQLQLDELVVISVDPDAAERACALVERIAGDHVTRLEAEAIDPAELGIEEEL